MLYEIEKPPAATSSVILLHPDDDVAVARLALPRDHEVQIQGRTLVAKSAVPAGHKIALRTMREGEAVHRYGNVIGFATRTIEPGEHVHVHNLGYRDHDASEIRPEPVAPPATTPLHARTFLGFRRADGRVGTRNYIAVVAASNCAAYTAELIASSFANERLPENVDGVVAFPHGEGCAMSMGPDLDQVQSQLD